MPAVRENSVDQAKPMMTSDSDRTDSRQTSQTVCTRRGRLVSKIGEGKGDDDAADGDQDRQHQREAEHAGEEGRQEAGVIVEDEIGRVEAGRIALEEAHRDHRREGHDEEHDQHHRREEQRRVVGDRFGRLASHAASTTQLSGGSTRPTFCAGNHVGPFARRRHRDDGRSAGLDEGLDGAAEVAHEGHRSGDGVAAGRREMHVFRPDRDRRPGHAGRQREPGNGLAENGGAARRCRLSRRAGWSSR